jgi:hypothetical protein
VGNVKLLGDAKKVEAALKKRRQSREDVIENLRAIVVGAAGDVPLKKQLDIVWSRFDVNGRGLHSFNSQLNLSAFNGPGDARRGCVAREKGVFGGL